MLEFSVLTMYNSFVDMNSISAILILMHFTEANVSILLNNIYLQVKREQNLIKLQ